MRWGIVGTGPWARMVHAPSFTTHSEARLVTVWGRDPAKRESLARESGVPAAATLDELLASVDAVSLSVAPSAQAAIAAQVVARGRHVLLEKPVSTDVDVVRRLADGIPPGVGAMVFLTRLFEPVRARWVRESIGCGYSQAEVTWVSAALAPGSPYADSKWRTGPGVVWDVMPHVLSQVVPVLGEVVDAEIAEWPEYDGLHAQLRHRNGGVSDVRMTLNARPDQRVERIRFSGADGDAVSPEGPLDFVAAHRGAIQVIEAGAGIDEDPLLSMATIRSAVATTEIMRKLAVGAGWESGQGSGDTVIGG